MEFYARQVLIVLSKTTHVVKAVISQLLHGLTWEKRYLRGCLPKLPAETSRRPIVSTCLATEVSAPASITSGTSASQDQTDIRRPFVPEEEFERPVKSCMDRWQNLVLRNHNSAGPRRVE